MNPTQGAAKKPLGPNVRRLMSIKMAKDAIPDGGGFADGVRFLSSKENIIAGARSALEWVEQGIQAVRDAAEPNQFKHSTDEEIAAVILQELETRRKRG